MQEVLLSIKVTANASSNKIGETYFDINNKKWQKVYVTATPENGKANVEVIKLLSKQYNIAKSCFTIVAGKTENYKIVRIKSNNKK